MAPLVRDFIDHPGAVAVLVLNEANEVLMINQYRHPVRMKLWEIPAGLMDIEGEAPHLAAARELAEEADLVATDWSVLVDLFLSPGSSSEAIRIFLARNPVPVPEDERHERTDEESDMEIRWVPLGRCDRRGTRRQDPQPLGRGRTSGGCGGPQRRLCLVASG